MTNINNPAIFSNEIANELQHASRVIAMGQRRGWPVPAGYTAAAAVLAAAEALTMPAPAPPVAWPTDPATVAEFCRTVAAERAAVQAASVVAREVAGHTRVAMILAVREAAGDYLHRLIADFDRLAVKFAGLAGTAPRTISGHESAAQLAEHAELLRSASDLTTAALDRGQLALLSGESVDLGSSGLPWLIVRPPADCEVSILEVTAALRDLAGQAPTDVDGWARVSRIGLSMAGPGEALTRIGTYHALLLAHSHSHSGGLADRPWRELTVEVAEKAADPTTTAADQRRSGRRVMS